jgi:hypothetical protein
MRELSRDGRRKFPLCSSRALRLIVVEFGWGVWPFALVAAFDPAWRSQDAGNVFLAAYLGANVVWFHHTGCGFCIFAASFRTIPIVSGALIAHKLGSLRHYPRLTE